MARAALSGRGDGGEGRFHVVRDARAGEALLVARARAFLAQVREDPQRLSRPLVIVVASRALRSHLVAALVRGVGGALAGVDVRTVAAFARDLLVRAGEPVPGGDRLLELLAGRAAARRPVLERALGRLDGGHACMTGAVVDLVDAGAVPAGAAALDDWLEAAADAGDVLRAEVDRARAIVGTMAEVELERERLGLTGRAGVWRRATDLVRTRGDELLGSAEIWLVAFADATGLLADLLDALARRPSTHVLACDPLDPAAADERPASEFPRRLAERLAAASGERPSPPLASARASLSLCTARGHEAEVRHALEGARAAMRAGVPAERIAIVARDLGPYVTPLRVLGARLGVALWAPGARGPLTAAGRRIAACLDLLEDGADTPTTRAIEALDEHALIGHDGAGVHAAVGELVLACHALGAGRLGGLAALDVGAVLGTRDAFALPLRTRASGAGPPEREPDAAEEDGGDQEDGSPAPFEPGTRRRLPRARLERAVATARAVVDTLDAWVRARSTAEEHAAWTAAFAAQVLGWPEGDALDELREAALALAADVGAATRLSAREWAESLARETDSRARDPLGSGGGVRVLGVMEARGMAFDALFVLGLARDRFPERVSEDPVLPDALRARMAELLPDMPVRARRHAEERHLFADLVAAAPHVVLVAPLEDDDGRDLAPSPFFARLAEPLGPHAVVAVASLAVSVARGAVASAFEHAVLHGAGGRRQVGSAWREAAELAWLEARGIAFDDARERRRAQRFGEVREAVLAAYDLPREGSGALGPFDGRIGPPSGDDPRNAPLFVTTLERFAECGWRTLLERLLRLTPTPDPLAALPALEKRLVGSLVHDVLERIVRPHGGAERLEDARERPGVDVAWPSDETVEALLEDGARRIAADEGLMLPGLVRALVARARRTLLLARGLEFEDGVLRGVVGAELDATIDLEPWLGKRRRLHLRVDRVDRAGPAALRLVDYKTGKPKVTALQAKARDNARVRQIARGALLQGFAYSVAGGGEGVYVHLEEEDRARARVDCDARDPRQAEAFGVAVRTLDAAWRAGAFPPRLVDDKEKEPAACGWCDLAIACLRGDSAARARLLAAGERDGAEGPDGAWLDLWRLPERASALGGGGKKG